jgi:hypothetical protein
MELPKWDELILVIDTAAFYELPPIDQCKGMVYVPGLVCSNCQQVLKTGFVVKNGKEDGIYGRECIRAINVSPWISLMDRARYYLQWRHFSFEEELKPTDRKTMRGLSIYLQLHPWSDFARGMFARMLDRHALTAKQDEAIQKMLSEAGDLDDLRRRRDQIRSLSFLYKSIERNYRNNEDLEKVESLLRQAMRKPLSDAQGKLIRALQDVHSHTLLALNDRVVEQWPIFNGKVDWTKDESKARHSSLI